MKKPFIHKFVSFSGNTYVYDVRTNEIFRVKQPVFDLIDDPDILSTDSVFNKWKNKYDVEVVSQALREISTFQEKGYFLPFPDVKMSRVTCEECLDDKFREEDVQLSLNFTYDCNMRCKYCAYSGLYKYNRTHAKAAMSIDVAKKAIDVFLEKTKGTEKSLLSFYGGEPLVCSDRFVQIIKYAKKRGRGRELDFHFSTNGTLLNDSLIQFLTANNVFIQVSLDGPKDVHDRYRVFKDGSGTFDIVMDNLRKIRDHEPGHFDAHISYQATIAPPYRMLEVNEFFKKDEYSVAALSANFVDEFETKFFEKYLNGDRDVDDYNKQIKKLEREYIMDTIQGKDPSKFTKALFEKKIIEIHNRGRGPLGDDFRPNGICIPGTRRFFVEINGDIHPCERVGNAYRLGNVCQGGISNNRILEVVEEYINSSEEECSKCWAMRLCGMCFSLARKGKEFDMEVKRINCIGTRLGLNSAFERYVTIMEKNKDAYAGSGIIYR